MDSHSRQNPAYRFTPNNLTVYEASCRLPKAGRCSITELQDPCNVLKAVRFRPSAPSGYSTMVVQVTSNHLTGVRFSVAAPHGAFVQRLGRWPFKPVTRVRFPYALLMVRLGESRGEPPYEGLKRCGWSRTRHGWCEPAGSRSARSCGGMAYTAHSKCAPARDGSSTLPRTTASMRGHAQLLALERADNCS